LPTTVVAVAVLIFPLYEESSTVLFHRSHSFKRMIVTTSTTKNNTRTYDIFIVYYIGIEWYFNLEESVFAQLDVFSGRMDKVIRTNILLIKVSIVNLDHDYYYSSKIHDK